MSCCLKIMADGLNEGDFWLPPQFLSQDHDEDEFLTKFTQRLAHSTTNNIRGIYDGKLPTEINDPWRPNYESWNIATSPQSTLCNAIGGYHSKQASSRGSPNCLSPPYEEVMDNNMQATELLYAAAQEDTKLQQHTGTDFLHFCDPPEKSCPKQFKQQQSMKRKQKGYVQYMQQGQQDETRNSNSIAWPTLKKSQCPQKPTPAGSEMRAVFLGNQVTKSKRSGTGVFLPRPAGSWDNPSPGYLTVLFPERVVQALNLNLRATDTPQQLKKNDAALKHRENVVPAHPQQRWDMASSTVTNNELRLPQEWTY